MKTYTESVNKKSIQNFLSAIHASDSARDITGLGLTRCNSTWGFSDRRVPEHLLYLIVENRMVGRWGGQKHRLGPGDLLWLSPGTVHTFSNEDPSSPILLYHLRVDLPVVLQVKNLILRSAVELTSHFARLLDEYKAELPWRQARLSAELTLLFTGLLRIQQRDRSGKRTLNDGQRKRLYQLLHERWHDRLTPAQLAEELRLSADYFTRVFRHTYGRPPRRWLMEQRIHEAARRLDESNLRIKEVAYELGYPDVYLFSRQFKSVFGLGPRAYRCRLDNTS